jgi:hypothetical protein
VRGAEQAYVAPLHHLRLDTESNILPYPTINAGSTMKKTFHTPTLVEETTLAQLTLAPAVSEVAIG